MKLKKLDPLGPEVADAIVESIRKMTPEELQAVLDYRPLGVEETDMTGMLGLYEPATKPVEERREAA
jgi:hypothetical protein